MEAPQCATGHQSNMTDVSTKKASLDDLAALNAELAALVRARIPLEPELRRLAPQLPKGAGALADRLAQRLDRGDDLATAIAAEGDAIPPAYGAIVTAGLESGDLAGALEDMAESARRLASLRQTTGIALVIPISVVVVASILLSVVLQFSFRDIAWIAPKQLKPYEMLTSAPWLRFGLAVVIPLLAIALPLLWWWRSRRATGLGAPRWSMLGWIPGGRRLHRLGAAATFAEVMRMMIASGAPLERALRIAAGATTDRTYRRASLALADSCHRDATLVDRNDPATARAIQQLPSLVRVALRQAGRRDVFAASLARAARAYHSRAESLGGALAEYVPALLTVGVAGTVTALYAIGLLWPYTTMLYTMASGMWR
jgi:type II secretory pathway component PulF